MTTLVHPQRYQPVRPAQLTDAQHRYLRLRRAGDIAAATGALVVAAVPLAVVSLGVLVTMGRPVLFTQERITRDGRIFVLRKFRSMRAANPAEGVQDDAARLVPFGRFLRSSSLDELPSLWNILRGDMSLIGPRPLTADYLGRFSAEQFTRHAVPAGLTGYAQVHGRNTLGWEDRMRMDRDYVHRLGPRLDLKILLSTVGTVWSRKGVTDEDGISMADFPGPQFSTHLDLEGPDADGAWTCRARGGRMLLAGTAQILDDDVVELSFHTVPPEPRADLDELDEAVRLVLSRLRARHPLTWALVNPLTTLPAPMAAVLERAGFFRPPADLRFSSVGLPPASSLHGETPLIGYLGLADLALCSAEDAEFAEDAEHAEYAVDRESTDPPGAHDHVHHDHHDQGRGTS